MSSSLYLLFSERVKVIEKACSVTVDEGWINKIFYMPLTKYGGHPHTFYTILSLFCLLLVVASGCIELVTVNRCCFFCM